jgi:sugar transferase (PEP-CTERM/EpsH1 system associated)
MAHCPIFTPVPILPEPLRILVLLSRFPYPLERGDKLRAFHQLRILSQQHEILLCALHEDQLDKAWLEKVRPFCTEMVTLPLGRLGQMTELVKSTLGNRPFQVSYFHSPSAKRLVEEKIAAWRPDLIYCQLLRTAAYVDNVRNIPKVMDFQDAFAKGMERRLETDPWYLRPLVRSEMKRLQLFEREVFQQFDAATIISEQDREQLSFPERDKVTIVRNGVEMKRFTPSGRDKTIDVLFAGNMGYPPNIEAGVFLAKEVMPLVRERIPNARLMLAGARPSFQVRQLADDLTEVTGWVDDIRDCYDQAKVFAAPMLIGTGLQNKLLEAMAMRLPCVTTPLANNALGARPGQEVLIASTSSEFAEWIVALLTRPELANDLAGQGHDFIQKHFSWEAQTQPLLQIFDTLVRKHSL